MDIGEELYVLLSKINTACIATTIYLVTQPLGTYFLHQEINISWDAYQGHFMITMTRKGTLFPRLLTSQATYNTEWWLADKEFVKLCRVYEGGVVKLQPHITVQVLAIWAVVTMKQWQWHCFDDSTQNPYWEIILKCETTDIQVSTAVKKYRVYTKKKNWSRRHIKQKPDMMASKNFCVKRAILVGSDGSKFVWK